MTCTLQHSRSDQNTLTNTGRTGRLTVENAPLPILAEDSIANHRANVADAENVNLYKKLASLVFIIILTIV